jgi:hypothetical protein
MYSGVPQKEVAPVEWSLTPSLDRPKSVRRTLPYWSNSTFSGLRSLWREEVRYDVMRCDVMR